MTGKCKKIIICHFHDWPEERWAVNHANACQYPQDTEKGTWFLINAFADLADGYFATSHGSKLGQDGYFAKHAQDLIEAMRAYLNFDVGRFDCGTLDRLICDLAVAAGVSGYPK